MAIKNPTELEMAEVYRREFPMCRLSGHERAFLAFVHIAREHGVGYGWMRQAIGLAWKTADPLGYIDDDRIVSLHTRELKLCTRCGSKYDANGSCSNKPCQGGIGEWCLEHHGAPFAYGVRG